MKEKHLNKISRPLKGPLIFKSEIKYQSKYYKRFNSFFYLQEHNKVDAVYV